jgi:hypothetical protein
MSQPAKCKSPYYLPALPRCDLLPPEIKIKSLETKTTENQSKLNNLNDDSIKNIRSCLKSQAFHDKRTLLDLEYWIFTLYRQYLESTYDQKTENILGLDHDRNILKYLVNCLPKVNPVNPEAESLTDN